MTKNSKAGKPVSPGKTKAATVADASEDQNPLLINKPPSAEELMAKFKAKKPSNISSVKTLLSALPVLRIGEVGDWTRLHPSEDEFWSDELCFVDIPIAGDSKHTETHLIDEELALRYLSGKKIKRHRLALASKPHDIFFLCIVPSRTLITPGINPPRAPATRPGPGGFKQYR